MNTMTVGSSWVLAMAITLTSGCMVRHNPEIDARISGAEDMASAARVHANEAYIKAEQALKVALDAQQSANAANKRASLMLDKK